MIRTPVALGRRPVGLAVAALVALLPVATPGTLGAQAQDAAPPPHPVAAVAAGKEAASDAPPALATATAAPLATTASGPTAEGLRAGVARPGDRTLASAAAAAPEERAPVRNQGLGRAAALMAVGATAVVVGILVGGDGGSLLAVGGAVVGLVGLYQYLR